MLNKRMEEKLRTGAARDVAPFRQDDGRYWLPRNWYKDNVDYCDRDLERYIWSIGRDRITGETFASTTGEFYDNPRYECLWLR